MKTIFVRGDDLGYSKGVNAGIVEAVKSGNLKNVGVMINMPDVTEGLEALKDVPVCLGLHVNITNGAPVSDPGEIPSLCENGLFNSSSFYRNQAKEGNDPADYADVVKEAKAQIEKFKEMTGKDPAYIDFHAVFSNAFMQGVEDAAKEAGIVFIGMPGFSKDSTLLGKPLEMHVTQADTPEELAKEIEGKIEQLDEDHALVLVFHPGYVDWDLLQTSSLTTKRAADTAYLASDAGKTVQIYPAFSEVK